MLTRMHLKLGLSRYVAGLRALRASATGAKCFVRLKLVCYGGVKDTRVTTNTILNNFSAECTHARYYRHPRVLRPQTVKINRSAGNLEHPLSHRARHGPGRGLPVGEASEGGGSCQACGPAESLETEDAFEEEDLQGDGEPQKYSEETRQYHSIPCTRPGDLAAQRRGNTRRTHLAPKTSANRSTYVHPNPHPAAGSTAATHGVTK